jgi:hypothetical protein
VILQYFYLFRASSIIILDFLAREVTVTPIYIYICYSYGLMVTVIYQQVIAWVHYDFVRALHWLLWMDHYRSSIRACKNFQEVDRKLNITSHVLANQASNMICIYSVYAYDLTGI